MKKDEQRKINENEINMPVKKEKKYISKTEQNEKKPKFEDENNIKIDDNNKKNEHEKYENEKKRNIEQNNTNNILTHSTKHETENIKLSEQNPNENPNKIKKKYIKKNNDYKKNEMKSKIIENKIENEEINDMNYNNNRTELSFEERQNFFIKLYKKRKEDLEKLKNQDEKNFFKPYLISKQLNNSNNYNKNIYEKNYLFAQKYQKNKEDLYKKYYETPIQPILLGKEGNERILQKKNNEIFSKIFKELDSDEDNYISSYLINTKRTPKEVLKILQPLLSELNEDKQFLDEEDFIVTMNKFFEILSKEERDILLNAYKPKRSKSSFMNYNNNNNNNNSNKNKKNNNNNFYKKRKISNYSNRLASQHDKKFQRMFDNYLKTYNENNRNQIFFDNKHNIQRMNMKRNDFFNTTPMSVLGKNNDNFSMICNYNYDNYIKSLN